VIIVTSKQTMSVLSASLIQPAATWKSRDATGRVLIVLLRCTLGKYMAR